MDEFSTTSGKPEEADEDILTYTISDEEIEAAVSIESGRDTWFRDPLTPLCF